MTEFPKPPFPRAQYLTTFTIKHECAHSGVIEDYEKAIDQARVMLESVGAKVEIDHKHQFVGLGLARPNTRPTGITRVCPVSDSVCSTPAECDRHPNGCQKDDSGV